jgi:hypothetical protein
MDLLGEPTKPSLIINEAEIKARYSYLIGDKINMVINLIRLLEPDLNSEDIINDICIDCPPYKMKIDEEYYSSTITNTTISEFSQKSLLYFTTQLNQALLHPLDRLRLMPVYQPNLFKFKLNSQIKLIRSTDINNVKIFNSLGEIINRKIQNFFLNIDNLEYNDENINKILNGNKNVRILLVIEAMNYFIDYYKGSQHIINGYSNQYDQNEIAITNFNNLVNRDSIIRFKYIKFFYKQQEFIFSDIDIRPEYNARFLDSSQQFTIYTEQKSSSGINKIMMGCPGKSILYDEYIKKNKETPQQRENDLRIHYRQFVDTDNNFVGEEIIFDCANTTYRDFYLIKYLKYKNKYLKLKSKVL